MDGVANVMLPHQQTVPIPSARRCKPSCMLGRVHELTSHMCVHTQKRRCTFIKGTGSMLSFDEQAQLFVFENNMEKGQT